MDHVARAIFTGCNAGVRDGFAHLLGKGCLNPTRASCPEIRSSSIGRHYCLEFGRCLSVFGIGRPRGRLCNIRLTTMSQDSCMNKTASTATSTFPLHEAETCSVPICGGTAHFHQLRGSCWRGAITPRAKCLAKVGRLG